MKKSYMNIDNLLSEGFFSKFLSKLTKKIGKLEKKSKDKTLTKNPKVKAAWRDVEKSLSDQEVRLRKFAKSVGMDYDKL